MLQFLSFHGQDLKVRAGEESQEVAAELQRLLEVGSELTNQMRSCLQFLHLQIIYKSFTNHLQIIYQSFTNHLQIIYKSFTNHLHSLMMLHGLVSQLV